MDVFWFLPTHGDGHYLGTTQGARPVTLNYLKQVAQAADSLGYYGVLIPTGRSCEDSWVIASALVPLTERLRYLVAIRPGIISPTVSARMVATLDRLSKFPIMNSTHHLLPSPHGELAPAIAATILAYDELIDVCHRRQRL